MSGLGAEHSTISLAVSSYHELPLFSLIVRVGQSLETTILYEPDVESSQVRAIRHEKELRRVSGVVVGVYFRDGWLIAELRTHTGSKHHSIKLSPGVSFTISGEISSLDRQLASDIEALASVEPVGCIVLDTSELSIVSASHYHGVRPLKRLILPHGEPTSARERAKDILSLSRTNRITTLLYVVGSCGYTRTCFEAKPGNRVVSIPYYTGDSELILHKSIRQGLGLSRLDQEFHVVDQLKASSMMQDTLNFESIVKRMQKQKNSSIMVVCNNCSSEQFRVLGSLLDVYQFNDRQRIKLITSSLLNYKTMGYTVVSIRT